MEFGLRKINVNKLMKNRNEIQRRIKYLEHWMLVKKIYLSNYKNKTELIRRWKAEKVAEVKALKWVLRKGKVEKKKKKRRSLGVLLSVIGIILTMFAGGLLVAWLNAEDSGWLSVPWLEIHDDSWTNWNDNDKIENVWLMHCWRYIPYWQTTAERAYEAGYLTGSCSTLMTLWRDKNQD